MGANFNAAEFNGLVLRRRSVFPEDYTGERVDDAIVKQMIDNARWAPTHKMTEPWRFLVFTGDGIRALATAQADLYKSVTELDGTFAEKRYKNLLCPEPDITTIDATEQYRTNKSREKTAKKKSKVDKK